MKDLFLTFIVGIIEGITEWLPVSSTGHMILFNEFFPLDVTPEFYDVFLVVIQLGAILAVVVTYFKNLFPFRLKKDEPKIKKDVFSLWGKIIVSCLPAALIGVLFEDTFDALFYNATSVSLALIIFGILFMLVETFNKKTPIANKVSEITYKTAFIIGAFQVLAAVFPGVSRSGATILGALIIGVSRVAAAEFTFYLAVPVMAGASLLKTAKFVLDFGFSFTSAELLYLAVGIVTAFLVSLLAIKFLVGFVKKHDFKVFGVYRILLGLLVLFIL